MKAMVRDAPTQSAQSPDAIDIKQIIHFAKEEARQTIQNYTNSTIKEEARKIAVEELARVEHEILLRIEASERAI